MVAAEREPGGLRGVWGRPFVDLERLLELSGLQEVHREITESLACVPVSYTGGSHRSMGITPPSQPDGAFGDYGEALAAMTEAERERFVALADDDLGGGPQAAFLYGEEGERELSPRQMSFLKYRFGVYFPWQVFFEMMPNRYWNEKSSGQGKAFSRLALHFFPKTIELVRSLPFSEMGRCNVMGLDPYHHGTIHRDAEPGAQPEPDHFILLCPAGNKRLFLWDEARRTRTYVCSRAYWFNDADYHGVAAAPYFRYSIRVDGIFEPDFLRRLRDEPR